jgi:serine/threonine-protein kinase CHEK1
VVVSQRKSSASFRQVKPFTSISSVYRATNSKLDIVAACKVVPLTPETTSHEMKVLKKEIQVHSSLKHVNILEFINAVIVEADGKSPWIPAVYMLLEIAAGGDLFDKIGEIILPNVTQASNSLLAPDVGVDDKMAHLYFSQLVAGMVSHVASTSVMESRQLQP